MLSLQLKEKTTMVHKESEKKMIAQLKKISTTEDYILFLNWLYGYYKPLEERLAPWVTSELIPDTEKRSHAGNILLDIQESGISTPPPEIAEDLPRIDSFARAMGALYVLEGSTLGGRIIATMITRQLRSVKSLFFFNSYGKETENMWLIFKSYLDRPYTEEEEKEILSAATETFITFKNRIGKYELHPQL